MHYEHDWLYTKTRSAYFINKMLMHQNVRRFQAKNYRLRMADWQHMFVNYFASLRELNLSLSCSDSLLQLVAQHCPLLEKLNAMSKFEPVEPRGGNAMSFTMAVSDRGLAHLHGCQQLRVLAMNEARSYRNGMAPSITHDGLRKLLRNVPALENLNYSDLGTVIARHMNDVPQLRLKSVRHFSATPATLTEIFRLCPQLDELNLVFFTCEARVKVVQTIIRECPRVVRALELSNLTLGDNVSSLMQSMGANLSYMSLINNEELYSFADLQAIAQFCPKLQYLGMMRLCNTNDPVMRPPNRGQFAELTTLYMIGHDLHLEQMLTFCTENAEHLETVKVSDPSRRREVDDLFLNRINLHNVETLELSAMMEFSLDAVQQLIRRYGSLKILKLYCKEDCTELIRHMKKSKYVLTLINKNMPSSW